MLDLNTLKFEGKRKCTNSETAKIQLFGLYSLI